MFRNLGVVTAIALSTALLVPNANAASRLENSIDDKFYSTVVASVPQLSELPQDEMVELAATICSAFAADLRYKQVSSLLSNEGWRKKTIASFIDSSIKTYCTDQLPKVKAQISAVLAAEKKKKKKAARCKDLYTEFIVATALQNPRKADRALKSLASKVKNARTRRQIDKFRIDYQDGEASRALYRSTANRLKRGWC